MVYHISGIDIRDSNSDITIDPVKKKLHGMRNEIFWAGDTENGNFCSTCSLLPAYSLVMGNE